MKFVSLLMGLLLVGCNETKTAEKGKRGPDAGATDNNGQNPDNGAVSVPGGITYYQHTKPIFDSFCANCHKPGAIGPMSFTSYDEVLKYKDAVKSAVVAKTMPPWGADRSCREYFGDSSLSQEQINMISGWVDAGAPAGDPNSFAAGLTRESIKLSRVDHTLKMPAPFTPQGENGNDQYRCMVLDWPEASPKYVTGFNALVDNDAVVHHIIAYIGQGAAGAKEYKDMDAKDPGAGYACKETGPGGSQSNWLGAWAPGGQGSDNPAGTGILIEPGSVVILQMHYNISNGASPDQSGIEVSVADTVTSPAKIVPFLNPLWVIGLGMNIPANQKDVKVSVSSNPGAKKIYSAALHMHSLATSAKITLVKSGGAEECVLNIPKWDWNWQNSYGLKIPVSLGSGDKLRMDCTYDNTAANQPTEGGVKLTPRNVKWGEKTTDEMCLGILYTAD